jgi:hypothetical protein
MPDATPLAMGITRISGNKVEMDMHDGLAGIPPDVYPKIITGGVVASIEKSFHAHGKLEECHLFLRSRLKKVRNMPEGNDKRMPFADRVDVVDSKRQFILYDKALTKLGPAKRACCIGHFSSHFTIGSSYFPAEIKKYSLPITGWRSFYKLRPH